MGEGFHLDTLYTGQVFIKDEDGNYSKVEDFNDIQEVTSFTEDNSYEIPGFPFYYDLDSNLSITISGTFVGFRRFEKWLKYGWKANGPVRKKLLDQAIRLRYRVKEMTT